MSLPQLLDGAHPALAALRAQLQAARVTEVELTGAGFYVDFEVPAECPLAEMFEGYTYDGTWDFDALVIAIKSVAPVFPG